MSVSRIIFLVPLFALNCLWCHAQCLPFPESRFAVVDDVCIHHRLFLPKDTTAIRGNVLLIHGFAGSTFSWRYAIPFLFNQGFAVLAIDLPAFGYSDRKNGLEISLADRAEIIWKLIDTVEKHRNISGEWLLVGHSMGGLYIETLFRQRPKKVSALLFVDAANLDMREQSVGKTEGWWALYSLMPLASPLLTSYPAMRSFLSSAYGQKARIEDVEGYQLPLQKSGTGRAILRLTLGSQKIPSTTLPHYPPVLIVWGEKDSWIPPESGQKLHKQFPGSLFYIIEKAAHCPMETHPDEFNSILSSFISTFCL